MSDQIEGSMGRRTLRGLRQFFDSISQMANSPWGNGPGKGEDDDGKGGDGKRPGPRNPWVTPDPADQRRGAKPRGPSALDELLRKGRGGFGGGGSGGGGFDFADSGRIWKWGIVAVLAVWLFFSSFHIVPPEKEGVVTRLGSYARTVGPGVKLTWPAPIERIRMEDVRAIRTMAIGSPKATDENFVLTRDQSIVDLAYEVRWSVRAPELFFFQIANPEDTIREVAESAMRATVANFDLVQAIGPGRVEIEAQVQSRMQALLDEYRAGVTIQGIAIRQADPPSQVDEAFKEVTAARQEREAAINLARAYQQQVLERARGDTSAFDQIYEQYRLAPEVTRQRLYYETMEAVLSNVDKTIVEARGVTPYLPLNEVQRRLRAPEAVTKGGE
ncbi:protease modulator HflK [Sphingopyxis alaskensis]|jgi:modulator of FtsH protease HflK|uniref:HflK protein n=1 Tax=Sphingopyxis alaskensis (strain DSM 13593 / LMG 18877 / RB2256) TaxID=317655 RepID=Q1GQW4_SPHAL|nr:protease modulator HflK [Sphingopyxis alaskensis]ABF53958.1 HflK protein [Sphingopyxis alaskensis RB2256]MCM3418968.1 protease modulator HflK [Sphingopyxis alaskensis]